MQQLRSDVPLGHTVGITPNSEFPELGFFRFKVSLVMLFALRTAWFQTEGKTVDVNPVSEMSSGPLYWESQMQRLLNTFYLCRNLVCSWDSTELSRSINSEP